MKKNIVIAILCFSFAYYEAQAQDVENKWFLGTSFNFDKEFVTPNFIDYVISSEKKSYSFNPYIGRSLNERLCLGLNYGRISEYIGTQYIYHLPGVRHHEDKLTEQSISLLLRYALFVKQKFSMDLTSQAGIFRKKIIQERTRTDANNQLIHESSSTSWEDALKSAVLLGINYDFNAKWRLRLVSELMTYNKELQIDFSQEKNIDFSGDSTFDWTNQLSNVHFAVEFRF